MVRLVNNYTVICLQDTPTCVCDFRVNTRECNDSGYTRTIFLVLLPLLFVACVMSLWGLYHHTRHTGLCFPRSRSRGILRPRLLDLFHLTALLYCLLQAIHLLLLLTDSYSSVAWAETGSLLPRLSMYVFVSLFPLSLIHWISAADPVAVHWTPNERQVDILGFCLTVGPLLTLVPIAVLCGRFADQRSFDDADVFFEVRQTLTGTWLAAYGAVLVFFWRRITAGLQIRERQTRLQHKFSDTVRIKRIANNVNIMVYVMLAITFCSSLASFIVGYLSKRPACWSSGANKFFTTVCSSVPLLVILGIHIAILFHNRKANGNNQGLAVPHATVQPEPLQLAVFGQARGLVADNREDDSDSQEKWGSVSWMHEGNSTENKRASQCSQISRTSKASVRSTTPEPTMLPPKPEPIVTTMRKSSEVSRSSGSPVHTSPTRTRVDEPWRTDVAHPPLNRRSSVPPIPPAELASQSVRRILTLQQSSTTSPSSSPSSSPSLSPSSSRVEQYRRTRDSQGSRGSSSSDFTTGFHAVPQSASSVMPLIYQSEAYPSPTEHDERSFSIGSDTAAKLTGSDHARVGSSMSDVDRREWLTKKPLRTVSRFDSV